MAVRSNILTDRGVAALKAQGLHADGAGLYLQITKAGVKSWVYRYKVASAVKTIGLGPARDVSLKHARDRAAECRRLRLEGVDPLAHKRRASVEPVTPPESPAGKTFADVAAEYLEAHAAGWKSDKTIVGWRRSLERYAGQAFGSVPVDKIDRPMIVALLRPIWNEKPETAGRVRRHVEAVLNFAKVHDYRTGENPATWRGNLSFAFAQLAKVRAVKHHPALPYAELPMFLKLLRERAGVGALAFELAILTACRTSEVLGAEWQEVDFDSRLWSIPGARMKAGKPHVVPLSDRALEVLKAAADFRRGADSFIWPGDRPGKPVSNMTFLMLLRRMGRRDLTGHGFRSTFRDWVSETTDFPGEVAEMALAHAVANKVEAAYRRGDLLAKRRELMDAWAAYCCLNHK